jgi:hypothetical protein
MPDIIDDANATADLFLAAALSIRQQSAKVPTHGIGMCLNCGADVEGDRRWCDVDCRNQWDLDNKRRERT